MKEKLLSLRETLVRRPPSLPMCYGPGVGGRTRFQEKKNSVSYITLFVTEISIWSRIITRMSREQFVENGTCHGVELCSKTVREFARSPSFVSL